MEFAIFLETTSDTPIPPEEVRAHVEGLRALDDAGCLIAAGPFKDRSGGLILAHFNSQKEAERYAANDPFVRGGFETATIQPWLWSHRGNGFLGMLEPEPHNAFLSALRRRSTARQFAERSIPKVTVRSLLDAALHAPSEFNLQPWRPVICHSEAARKRLRDCCFRQEQVTRAAVAIIVAASTRVFHDDAPRAVDDYIAKGRWRPEKREARIAVIRSYYSKDPARLRLHAVKNAMLFGHQLLLAALSVGLAGFWLGGIDEDKVRSTFGIPDYVIVAGVVGLGWPDLDEPGQPRLPIDTVVSWDRWESRDSEA